MSGIIYFVALPFDVADGSVVIGQPIECPSAAAAIGRAEVQNIRSYGRNRIQPHW
jgi:hypothetical protein